MSGAEGRAAPDPRKGEPLDGRQPPEPQALSVPRLLLAPLRAAAWLVLTPIDQGLALLEANQVPARVYETLTSDDRLVGVRPSLRYQSGFALAGGISAFNRRTLGPGSLVAVELNGGPRFAGAGFILRAPGGSGFELQAKAWWQGDALFAGIRGQTLDELRNEGFDLARYQVRAASVALGWRQALGRVLVVSANAGVQDRQYGDGVPRGDQKTIREVYCPPQSEGRCGLDDALVPGFERGLQLAHVRASLGLDTRRHRRFGSGFAASSEGRYAVGLGRDPSEHATLRLGLGGVLAFGDHSLGLFGRGGMMWRLSEARIPFEELLSPTADRGIRGLRPSRIRGETELVASAEYRWLISPRVDALLFVDRGNAFGNRFSGASWADTFTSYGVSLQVLQLQGQEHWFAETLLGVLFAYTPSEGLRYALSAAATF